MTTAQDVLSVASRQIGNREHPPGSNRSKYGTWYGMDGNPWCAMFVSYCFHQAGMPLPIKTKKGFAYCPDGVNWFKKSGRWSPSNPAPGDVIFFSWKQDDVADHVGIVKSVLPNGQVESIEGNTSTVSNDNGGQVMVRQRGASLILGYGKPAYDGVSTASSSVDTSWPGVYITLASPVMVSEDIRVWQQWMIKLGYRLEADGKYGENSSQACRDFQVKQGIEVDGVVGPVTWDLACTLASGAPQISGAAAGPALAVGVPTEPAGVPAATLQQVNHGTFICTRNTVAKRRPLPSSQLGDSEKQTCAAGRIIPYVSLKPADAHHVLVEMDFGAGNWYFYQPHTDIQQDDDARISMKQEVWSLDEFVPQLLAMAQKHGLPLKTQHAYILATTQWETAGTFQPVREAFWLSEEWRKTNLRYYPYYGRGYVQLTWTDNYKKYASILNLPLLDKPDLVMNPSHALFILIDGFKRGVFTGQKIEDYINGANTDYVNARRCINATDKAQEIARLADQWYRKL